MSDSPSPVSFPRYVDARKVFSQKGFYGGELSRDQLPRLAGLLADGAFYANASLRFELDKRGRKIIEGEVEARLSVACQRCLKPLELRLADDIRLALVIDEAGAERLDDDVEPWIESEFKLDPTLIVEEQLLLSMPLAAYHDKTDCSPEVVGAKEALDFQGHKDRKTNPFAALEALKTPK